MPEPLLPVAITAKSKADEDKMSQAIGRLVAEDPTLRLENNAGDPPARAVVHGRGARGPAARPAVQPVRRGGRDRAAARAAAGDRRRQGAAGSAGTSSRPAVTASSRICHIEVEPRPSGSGLEFIDKIVGGVVPRQFIPSVEKGVRAQMERGVLAGYPMVDIRVTLFDGKAHAVDSSDMAFQKAGKARAAGRGGEGARCCCSSRWTRSRCWSPTTTWARSCRTCRPGAGRVLGTEPVPGGRTLVKAEMPELEITRYAIDLRSMSHGTGSFTRSYLRYEPLPVASRRQGR